MGLCRHCTNIFSPLHLINILKSFKSTKCSVIEKKYWPSPIKLSAETFEGRGIFLLIPSHATSRFSNKLVLFFPLVHSLSFKTCMACVLSRAFSSVRMISRDRAARFTSLEWVQKVQNSLSIALILLNRPCKPTWPLWGRKCAVNDLINPHRLVNAPSPSPADDGIFFINVPRIKQMS